LEDLDIDVWMILKRILYNVKLCISFSGGNGTPGTAHGKKFEYTHLESFCCGRRGAEQLRVGGDVGLEGDVEPS
jgi:hypothetical protein